MPKRKRNKRRVPSKDRDLAFIITLSVLGAIGALFVLLFGMTIEEGRDPEPPASAFPFGRD